MKLRLLSGLVSGCFALSAFAQQPVGVAPALAGLASQPATHTAFTFDHDMLQSAGGFIGGDAGPGPISALNSITVENYRYREPAFYAPENWRELVRAFNDAGWKHLVNQNAQNAGPGANAQPSKPLTDLWLHFRGAEIDDVTVLLRGPRQMSVIEVSGVLKPLDLVHLSGHFGIPRVDPGAVMVPAPAGR